MLRIPRSTGGLFILAGLALALPATAADTTSLCAATRSTVKIAEAPYTDGLLTAHGSWEVIGAAAVMLEYRIDQDRLQSEVRMGTSGTWEVTLPFKLCGPHTLRVFAFPVAQDGTRLAHCLERGSSTPSRFTISCAPVAEISACVWECAEADGGRHCTGSCTAAVSGGRPPYLPFWGVDGADFQPVQPPGPGPWTQPVACAAGQKISIKVRDFHGTGAWSAMVERDCGRE
jgi:hypothetical protein